MISESQKQNIVTAMQEYIDSKGLSNNKFARQMEISPSYISALVNKKWNEMPGGGKLVAIDDSYFHKIAKEVGFMLENEDWGHFDTPNFSMIWDVINDSREYKIPAAVDGETGLGKTYAIQEYRRANPKETYVIECAGDFTARRFMVELARVMGVQIVGSVTDIRLAIARKLSFDKSPVLIIDEAENLKNNAWNSIKSLMDAVCSNTNRKAGMVLFGANNFQQKMEYKANRMIEPFPQVHSRIKEGGYYELFSMNYDDKRNILDLLGISGLRVKKTLDSRCNNMRELYGAVTKLRREERRQNRSIEELAEIIL